MHRITRHLILAGISGITICSIYLLLDSPDPIFRFSMATAYTGLLLLCITLSIGPLNLIFKLPNPVSSYLRRDIGIWAGLISIVHVIIGLQRHFAGRIWKYFFHEGSPGQSISIRFDAFGLANHGGLIATIICIVLLMMSNNASLRQFGAVKWKNIQRLNYLSFLLVTGHAFLYQLLGKRDLGYIVIVAIVFILVLVLQWSGFKTNRQGSKNRRLG